MQCLVLVKFLSGGSLSPEEFFVRLGAKWSWVDYLPPKKSEKDNNVKLNKSFKAREGMCIADYESIEQLTIDLAIMPGAGISNVEIMPIAEREEVSNLSVLDVSSQYLKNRT